MTPHIESKKEEIAETVIMPGDPLRAKHIAEKYLENAKLVNTIRNMYAYTGEYHGKRITVFASGMGMPSMGIYAYELFHFYDVKKIIRVGSCGSESPDVHVKDIVLATSATTYSHFAELFGEEKRQTFKSSENLNKLVMSSAEKLNISLHAGDIITSDVFDVYVDHQKFMNHFEPKNYLAAEMESYALFYLAETFQREATCILTVVDSAYEKGVIVPPEEREKSLDQMIELALLTATL